MTFSLDAETLFEWKNKSVALSSSIDRVAYHANVRPARPIKRISLQDSCGYDVPN